MANGWIITLGLVWAYVLALFWLIRSGKMEKWGLSLFLGFILMIRTQHGRKLLNTIARPRRFWNAFGDFGILLTLGGMVLMTFFILLTVRIVLDPSYGVEPLAGNEILVIPGVNPFVPLWYGIIALIVTLVVHEGGHGVLARANDLKVKSLGLLYLIVPIGAFVEPDEEEMAKTTRRKRLRVFGAGATVNIVLSVLVLAALGAMVGAAQIHDGVPVASVTEGGGAEAAGVEPGDMLVRVDGNATPTVAAFQAHMEGVAPGDTLTVTTRDGVEHQLTTSSRWDTLDEADRQEVIQLTDDGAAYCEATFDRTYEDGAACAADLEASPVLGIRIFQADQVQSAFTEPWGNSGINFAALIQLPIQEIRGAPVLSVYFPAFYETPVAEEVFWPAVNTLFWIFWINLLVGLTNILPMLPLDGGHMFRDTVAGVVEKVRPNLEQARQDRIVGRSATIVSLLIFGSIILQIVGPRLIN